MRLAYLLSQHPAINHPFMLREIRRLRELGWQVETASVRPPDRPSHQLTPIEREEAQSTFYIKQAGFATLLRAHLATVFTRPACYLRGLSTAMTTGRAGALYFAEAVILGHWMQRRSLAHVHSHYASTVAWIASRVFPITFSVTFHGQAEFANPAAFRLLEKIRDSLFCRAISLYGRSQMLRVTGYNDWPKIEVTYLGVDPRDFTPSPFRIDPSPFTVACVGQLAPVKGQHMLIAAMDLLIRQDRRVHLRIAGDGPDRAAIEWDIAQRNLQPHVTMEGFLNQDKLRELYAQSDALVLPSFAEGIPVVLMEAMAMEVPCVATWITGIPELIVNESDGLLVPPGDAQKLADAIARLMDDPNLRRRLAQSGRARVLDRFDLHRNTELLAEVFTRRLSPASTAR